MFNLYEPSNSLNNWLFIKFFRMKKGWKLRKLLKVSKLKANKTTLFITPEKRVEKLNYTHNNLSLVTSSKTRGLCCCWQFSFQWYWFGKSVCYKLSSFSAIIRYFCCFFFTLLVVIIFIISVIILATKKINKLIMN